MVQGGRVGRPPDGNSAETRQRILQVARQRFAADGYRATTNRIVAADAGLTSGAIYHYFESKDELYAAAYNDAVDELYTALEKAATEHTTLTAQFAAVMRRSGELAVVDPSIAGFIVAVALETKRQPELLELMAPQAGRHQRFWERLVGEAVDRGELPIDIDQRAVVDVMGAVLTGIPNMPAIAADPERYVAAAGMVGQLIALAAGHASDGTISA